VRAYAPGRLSLCHEALHRDRVPGPTAGDPCPSVRRGLSTRIAIKVTHVRGPNPGQLVGHRGRRLPATCDGYPATTVSAPGIDKVAERPLDEMVQTVSEQAMALARKEVDRARRELTAKARHASGGAAMLGGAALLGTLAAGTGTAALVLLLSGRTGPSAAALGVTGLYAGAGVRLAQEGLTRLREVTPPSSEETVESVKQNLGSAKKRGSTKNRAHAAKDRTGSAKSAQAARTPAGAVKNRARGAQR
jgi:putative superfamily III holin-X